MKKYYLLALLFLFLFETSKVLSIDKIDDLNFKFGGYIDTYIATDNDNQYKPWETNPITNLSGTNQRAYSYNDNIKNEFGLNIAMLSVNITYKDLVRSRLVIQSGDLAKIAYPNYATSSYSPSIQEANVGYRLAKGLWLDAGLFLTHIGGEVYLPKDNFFTSHSMVTYFEPIYQMGAKLSYETGPLSVCVHILNGNGIIQDNNDNKTFGLFCNYNILSNLSASYAGVYGNEENGGTPGKTNMLHNICLNYNPTNALSLKAQLDLGSKADGVSTIDSSTMKYSYSNGSYTGFSLQGKYQIIPEFAAGLRYANINNEDGIEGTAVKGSEITIGLEYKPFDKSYIRFETRMLNFDDKYKYFLDSDRKATNSRMDIMLNFGIWFD